MPQDKEEKITTFIFLISLAITLLILLPIGMLLQFIFGAVLFIMTFIIIWIIAEKSGMEMK